MDDSLLAVAYPGSRAPGGHLPGNLIEREGIMDPEKCWRDICANLKTADGCLEDALWMMDELAAWLARGGFRPDGVPMADAIRAGQRFLEAVQRANARD